MNQPKTGSANCQPKARHSFQKQLKQEFGRREVGPKCGPFTFLIDFIAQFPRSLTCFLTRRRPTYGHHALTTQELAMSSIDQQPLPRPVQNVSMVNAGHYVSMTTAHDAQGFDRRHVGIGPRSSSTVLSSRTAAIGNFGRKAGSMAWRIRASGDPLFWATQLLPAPRRLAMHALYAFCREVESIAHSKASPSLKQALLFGWRGEIALLYEGR